MPAMNINSLGVVKPSPQCILKGIRMPVNPAMVKRIMIVKRAPTTVNVIPKIKRNVITTPLYVKQLA